MIDVENVEGVLELFVVIGVESVLPGVDWSAFDAGGSGFGRWLVLCGPTHIFPIK